MEQVLKRYGNIIKDFDMEEEDDGEIYYYVWLRKPWVINDWQYPYPYDALTGVTKKECLQMLKKAYKDEEVWKHLDDQQWLNEYAKNHK